MQKIFGSAMLVALAACGVPPEEDATTKTAVSPMNAALFVQVKAEDLAQSEAWAEMVADYQ